MLKALDIVLSLHSKVERFTLFYWLFFPLFLCFWLSIISIIFPLQDKTLIFLIIISYLVTWIITLLLILYSFYIFYYYVKKTKQYDTNKKDFGKTINYLIKNRFFSNLTVPDFIVGTLFFLYFFELFMIIFLIKNDFYQFAIFYFFTTLLFSMFINKIRNISIGLQESEFKTFSLTIFLFLSFLTFFILIFYKGFDANKWDISILSPLIVPIVVAIIDRAFLRNRPKQKGERVGWSRLLITSTIIMEFIISFLAVYLILFIIVGGHLFALGIISGSMAIVYFGIISIILCIVLLIILPLIFFNDFSRYFTRSLTEWKIFFDCYYKGLPNKQEKETYKLVKLIGTCKAISISDKYRKYFHNYNQHFLLQLEDPERNIDVVSLEEKNPFKFTKKIVNEGDKIEVIGKFKSSLNEESFSSKKTRISDYFIAYHIEPQYIEKTNLNFFDDWFFSLILNTLKTSDKEIIENKDISEIIEKAVIKELPKYADIVLKDLKLKNSHMLKEKRKYKRKFEKRLFTRWMKPIDLLEMFINISFETGANFNNNYRRDAIKNNDIIFEVLTSMHARGCQISSEILELIKSGFAEGALARWRSLHEIAVISFFIKEFGQKVAEKYLHYELIETYREAEKYKEHCKELGLEPLPDDEFNKIENNVKILCEQYGDGFEGSYGWASGIIQKERIYFSDIEKKVNLEKFRPYYKMACNYVHASSKGIRFRLGLITNSPKSNILLAGPSNYGLADPGQLSAISLHQITTCLLTTKPSIESLITITTMQKLVDEISMSFSEVQSKIEEEEKTYLSSS